MKTMKLLIVFISLLTFGSCKKEGGNIPHFYDEIKEKEIFPTSINIAFRVYGDPGELFPIHYIKEGVLVGEDSTNLIQKMYDTDTTNRSLNVNIKSLKPNTTYYIKTFLETKDEIVYGNKCYAISTSPAGIPVLKAKFLSNDSNYNALISGIVVSDGGAPIEEYGFIVENKTYKLDNPYLQGDTLKFILNDLNVPVDFKFYARNKYGTSYSEKEFTSFNYTKVKHKNFEVNAFTNRIEGSCTFYGEGFWTYYLVISNSPIVISNEDYVDPYDLKGPLSLWNYRGSGPIKLSGSYRYINGWFIIKPNSTLYVRMVAKYFVVGSSDSKYYWTEEKSITVPSVIDFTELSN